ncbi:family 43 glycosylhydrolase [Amycolatopsis suaedae]|uniref:Glycoside hydrolase family 43 n=1 Tax=Amycolatopsis suaedae TaxID=2510978 RepID=A0A4Q7J190_9PSEU|nr:family 43 glycosylhydrolase [Amycolatopsis suaedae]RZQ60589.1 glycoside hydrolase family 43 [Amycolatopsis suaedae]
MTRALVLLLSAVLLLPVPAGHAQDSHGYANPVSASAGVDTFADPAVIQGKDGFWYAFGTTDPLREGEFRRHLLPVLRSADLVRWQHIGDAFAAVPDWAAPSAGLWAPDIRYADGRYLLYFTVTDTLAHPGLDSAIGVATAPTPVGPWTDSGGPVVAPRPDGAGSYHWTFDPAMVNDRSGRRWLYYGSYHGGLWVVPLSADALRTAGPAVPVASGRRFEGAYVVARDGWFYLFASSGNCCAGPATGYSVLVGRSREPAGPFTDADGTPLLGPRPGGTPVVQPNGNFWLGTGHNSIAVDAAGQDWLVYHAISRDDPYLDEPYGVNERPMLLDRLDWVDGWPVVRGGASQGWRRPPAAPEVSERFDRQARLPGGWRVLPGADPDSGGLLRHDGPGPGLVPYPLPHGAYAEVDLRFPGPEGSAGIVLPGGAVVTVEAAGTLRAGHREVRLPPGWRPDTWHTLSVRQHAGRVTAWLTAARLGDPVAEVEAVAWGPGTAGVHATGTVELDNLSAAPAATRRHRADPVPVPGRSLREHSDDFDGPKPGWSWVREPQAVPVHGRLFWPVADGDLAGPGGGASVLLRDAPRGGYVVETRLRLDLGAAGERDHQQAGLIAYRGDDDFARLTHVAIGGTRQVEYVRELPFAGRQAFGGMPAGTAADVVWLRLAYRLEPGTGRHLVRGGSSRDGRTWTWGGTWTFDPGPAPRIGLVAHGGAHPPVTAAFDYFLVSRLRQDT